MTRSETMKKKWTDPAYRRNQQTAMKAAWNQKRREKVRNRMMGNVLSPETIRKISESNHRTYWDGR